MKLSKTQVALFWRLWSRACKHQGWTDRRATEERRHQLLADCGFASLHDVDRTAGFGRVKAALLTLCDDLDGAIEADHPELDQARRLRHKIAWHLLPALGKLPEMAAHPGGPVAYAEAICRDKFGLPKTWQFDLDDLSADPVPRRAPDGRVTLQPSPLLQLVITLTARLRRHRGQNRHT